MDGFRKSSDLAYITFRFTAEDRLPDGFVNLTSYLKKNAYRVDLNWIMLNSGAYAAGDVVFVRFENPRAISHLNLGFGTNSNVNQISNEFTAENYVPVPIVTTPISYYEPQHRKIVAFDNNMGNNLSWRIQLLNQLRQPLTFTSATIQVLVYLKPDTLFLGTNQGYVTVKGNH